MRYENAMFSSDHRNLDNGIVFSIDRYTKPGRAPDKYDENNNPVWSENNYTEIGKMIHQYKYKNNDTHREELADILSEYITHSKELQEGTALVPCPSARFASVVKLAAQKIGINFYDCLRKQKPFSMKEISRDRRYDYAKLIEYDGSIPDNEKVILIDDIVETGATLRGCSEALQKKQANLEIQFLVLARTFYN